MFGWFFWLNVLYMPPIPFSLLHYGVCWLLPLQTDHFSLWNWVFWRKQFEMMQIAFNLLEVLSYKNYDSGVLKAVFCIPHSFHSKWTSSTRESCHFSVYGILSVIYKEQYGFMDIYFIWWVITQCYCYLYFCPYILASTFGSSFILVLLHL